jgi:malonyl CoA-acyl carrier protein transacylase
VKAALFPGQGIEARLVADALQANHPKLTAAREMLGYDLALRVTQIAQRPRAILPTYVAQPAIFVAGVIAFEQADGENFDYVAGHSLGEYTALVVAGSIPFDHGLQLVIARGGAMHRASLRRAGGMAAVMGLSIEEAEAICDATGVVIANDNSPNQVVLSGPEGALSEAAALVRERGGRALRLPLAGAFHSSYMQPATDELRRALDRVAIRSAAVPVVSNVSAGPYRAPGEIRRLLLRQLTHKVRFRESVAYLASRGVRDFVDFGPGNVVGRLAETTARHETEVAVRA